MQQHIQQSFQFVQWFTPFMAMFVLLSYRHFALSPRDRVWLPFVIAALTLIYAIAYRQLGIMALGEVFHCFSYALLSFCVQIAIGVVLWQITRTGVGFCIRFFNLDK